MITSSVREKDMWLYGCIAVLCIILKVQVQLFLTIFYLNIGIVWTSLYVLLCFTLKRNWEKLQGDFSLDFGTATILLVVYKYLNVLSNPVYVIDIFSIWYQILGIIDQPILRERWVGISGRTTKLNGDEISTRSCPKLSQAYLYGSFQLSFSLTLKVSL